MATDSANSGLSATTRTMHVPQQTRNIPVTPSQMNRCPQPSQQRSPSERVAAWAKELRKAGLDGNMDQLRAKAFMDLLLGTDSRPLGSHPGSGTRTPGGRAQIAGNSGQRSGDGAPAIRTARLNPGPRHRPGRWPG